MADLSSSSPIVVVAAVVERDDCFLVTRRLEGTHLAGAWEFPGGKREDGETDVACLERELEEELAVQAVIGPLLLETTHAYPGKTVELHFYECELKGEPIPQLGQQLRWVPRDMLDSLVWPEADHALIAKLRHH